MPAKASRVAFGEALIELGAKDERILTLDADLSKSTMTAGFAKGPLWAQPARVAADIESALERRNGNLYTPWFWRWIMLIVIHLPQPLFLRSKL